MTGFGTAETGGFKVEIKSLNQRHMDISVKMPSFLSEHEIPVRNIIKKHFSRGKFDVFISLTDKRKPKIRVDKELAKGMYEAFSSLQRELSVPGSIGMDLFSGYRELLITEEPECNTDALYDAIGEAMLKIEDARRKEGDALQKEMLVRLERLKDILTETEKIAGDAAFDYKETLSKRIAEIASNLTIDETRLAQEVAIMAQKADITEEMTRLKSHIQQFHSLLSAGGVIGRRLDFLLQEMNREANTIASKSDNIRLIKLTIEMKAEMEKLREQSQNIQ
ncbi:MAG: YicC/YloC family endoribonuclease [Thermodesulfovibrionales bacterium]|nr:YicC/YloC family endoribonuclease [Thermodesulfovibrionales bacterium]